VFFDKAHNVNYNNKSIDEKVKKSDVLFTEDIAIIHISGNKESSGRILKVGQGLYKCFGMVKAEVIGHNVNIMMPSLFAEKHDDYLSHYYKTGRQIIFN
jgi:PAS domain S-box-containing protein